MGFFRCPSRTSRVETGKKIYKIFGFHIEKSKHTFSNICRLKLLYFIRFGNSPWVLLFTSETNTVNTTNECDLNMINFCLKICIMHEQSNNQEKT